MMKALSVAAAGSVLFGLAAVWAPVALADSVGSACNDWMKISSDSIPGPENESSALKRDQVTLIRLSLGFRGTTRTLTGGPYLWSLPQQVLLGSAVHLRALN